MAQVDSLIRQALAENKLTVHKYYEFAIHAFKALKELRMDVLKDTTTVQAVVDQYNCIAKPTDYIDWVRVSMNRNGFLVPLEDRSTYSPDTTDQDLNEPIYANYYHNGRVFNLLGEPLGKQFGSIGDNTRDIFVEQETKIKLGNRFKSGSKVILEYLHLTSPTVTSLVSDYAESVIVAYITYCYVKSNPRKRLADIQYAKQIYNVEMKKLRARMNKLTARKLTMLLSRSKNQAPEL